MFVKRSRRCIEDKKGQNDTLSIKKMSIDLFRDTKIILTSVTKHTRTRRVYNSYVMTSQSFIHNAFLAMLMYCALIVFLSHAVHVICGNTMLHH